MDNKSLIIIGASARAAACSAWRAGYSPYWLDQFGDADLCRRFPGRVITGYPRQVSELIGQVPDAPFIYTGAMENYQDVLERLCAQRRLLGNPTRVCSRVRDPATLYEVLRRNRVPCPSLCTGARGRPPVGNVRGYVANPSPGTERWLVKPLRSAGGSGIRFHQGEEVAPGCYLQQYLPGESCSAVFIAAPDESRLLGVTRQLVGRPEFYAAPFGYCGSIGPLELHAGEKKQWERLGAVLAGEFQLRGLFGVDAIRHDGRVHPVEVNPRYTASVEALELALDVQAVRLHCHACMDRPIDIQVPPPHRLIGKAILYAPDDLVFRTFTPEGFSIADVPPQGARIKQGHPLLTLMVSGTGVDAIDRKLKRVAETVIQGTQ